MVKQLPFKWGVFSMGWSNYILITFGVVVILWIVALVRHHNTPKTDSEKSARWLMCQFLTLLLLGIGLSLVRERVQTLIIGFWLCNLLLLPIGIGVVYYLVALIRVYQTHK
jgi:accessory gene regulator protein AgrB